MKEVNHVYLDTDEMTLEEVNNLINHLKEVRARKLQVRDHYRNFIAMYKNMRDDHMSLVSKVTGEVMDLNDWSIYDETTRTFYAED